MVGSWLSIDGIARKTIDLFVGIQGKAHKVVAGYVGDSSGKARQVYPFGVLIPSLSGSYTYNGSSQSVQISGLNSNFVNVTGTTSAINAGTYIVTFSLKQPYLEWEDGSRSDKSRTWVISKKSLPKPVQKDPSVWNSYDGDTQGPQWENVNSLYPYAYYTAGEDGTTLEKYPGNYFCYWYITEDYAQNYWFSGLTRIKVNWSISKAYLSYVYSYKMSHDYSVPKNGSYKYDDLLVAGIPTGAIEEMHYQSSDTSLYTIGQDSGVGYVTIVSTGLREGNHIPLTVTIPGTDNYYGLTDTMDFSIH